MREILRTILRPLREMDGLLLACTHYPAIRHLIQPLVPDCNILDPSAMTAEEVVAINGSLRRKGPSDVFLTTGDAVQSREAGKLAFGIEIERFLRIELSQPG